jgi:hypothetical protein
MKNNLNVENIQFFHSFILLYEYGNTVCYIAKKLSVGTLPGCF